MWGANVWRRPNPVFVFLCIGQNFLDTVSTFLPALLSVGLALILLPTSSRPSGMLKPTCTVELIVKNSGILQAGCKMLLIAWKWPHWEYFIEIRKIYTLKLLCQFTRAPLPQPDKTWPASPYCGFSCQLSFTLIK